MAELAYRQAVWWGALTLPVGQARQWRMAGLELGVARQVREWQVWTHRTREQSEDNHEWRRDDSSVMPEADAAFTRFVFRQTQETLRLLPRLADRSVVIRPVNPLFVPAGQEATLFVSTPVWLGLYAEGAGTALVDIPVVIPRDTWFGPSTVRGELCYATKVFGRTDLSQLPPRPFRAVTPVRVRNMGQDTMPIERLNIPCPFLPVYAAESGRLWTPALSVEREHGNRHLRIGIDNGISTEAGHVALLTPPRRGAEEHGLIRVFDNFFD